jgi:DNA-binding winged helix-turn-helix (wHTH) protein
MNPKYCKTLIYQNERKSHLDKLVDSIYPVKFIDQIDLLFAEITTWKPNVVVVLDFNQEIFTFFRENQLVVKNINTLFVASCPKFYRTLDIEAYDVGFYSLIEENNDYLLYLKLSGLLKRKASDIGNRLVMNDILSIDPAMHQINIQGSNLHLSKNNFELFQYLAENYGRRLSPDEIAMVINGGKKRRVTVNAIAARMSRLRKALDSVGAGDWIQNDHGFGYFLQLIDDNTEKCSEPMDLCKTC